MLSPILKLQLEDIANSLRQLLNIDENKIINEENFDELISIIQETFSNVTIEFCKGYATPLLYLKNGKFFTIIIDPEQSKKDKLDDLVRLFTYAILFDKNTLNSYDLQEYLFKYGKIYNDDCASYLMLAFILPQKLFLHEITKYSCGFGGGRVDIEKMEQKVSRYVYKRGHDLEIW